jgi:hypothetical protein
MIMRCMQHAIAYTAPSQQQVYGAKATINVWDPAIEESNGFSLSQLWILSGSFNGSDLNSIEAGWQVRSTIPISSFHIAMRSIPFIFPSIAWISTS